MNTSHAAYVCGTSDAPLRYQTIGDALTETATLHGDREALVVPHQNIRMTWAALDAAVTELARGFLDLGLAPGNRVGIWSPNNAEWVLTQLATARAGLILVCVNPAYRISELEFALNKVGCRALVTAERLKTSDYLAMLDELAPELATSTPGELHAARLPDLRWIVTIGEMARPGCVRFEDVRARGEAADPASLKAILPTLQADDAINIQFTSGTTGAPKGATLTHFNILNNGRLVAATQQFTEADRLCIPVPLYHCFGMVMGVLGCLTHGTAMIFPGEAFEPASVLATVQAERCTALYGVPTMFIAELGLQNFGDFDLSTLRT
ncbi:MAG: AMP-binding protein, partial [Pseudomonadales bacterium]|nr:AMP-binding protein [Pseudomonadales bacterium]